MLGILVQVVQPHVKLDCFNQHGLMKKFISTLIFCFLIVFSVAATHVRGGYIRIVSQSQTSLTYNIEVIMFGNSGSSVFAGGEVDMGDGTRGTMEELAETIDRTQVVGEMEVSRSVIRHTYQAAGSYTITWTERYRNAGVLNIDNSVGTTFYTETTIVIDPLLRANSTPGLISSPAVYSKAGSTFYNSFACKDSDGDSLVYSLEVPLSQKEDTTTNYKWPNNVVFYEGQALTDKPTFSLHKLSGEFEWDTPLLEGEFVIAYRVLEYRKVNGAPRKISETVIDLHIINRMEGSNPPIVDFDYEVLADGKIGFTSLFESSADDTLEWFFYADVPFILQETGTEQSQTGGTTKGSYSFQGVLSPEVVTDKPLIVVLSARSVVPGSMFKSVRSFAIHPKGEAYVLTSIKALNDLKLNIHPNPATDFVQISLTDNNDIGELSVSLTNLAGQSILATHVPFRGNLATLDLESLAAGTYIIRAFIGDVAYISKLIKN